MSARTLRRWLAHPALWIALVACVAAGTYALVRARGPQVRTVVAVRQDLEQHIVASGRVWVPTRVRVAAQVPGLVLSVGAREGQRVESGALLVQLDDAEACAGVSQAEAALEQASARVEQQVSVGAIVASEDLRAAQTTAERAQAEVQRLQALAASGVVAQAALQGADARILLAAVLQARAQLVAAGARLAQTKIVALEDALVLTRNVEPGDVVQPSSTLFVLAASGGGAQLSFQSDERTFASIELGQAARVSADAYPKLAFDARVSYIAPSVDPERGSIEVRLRVADAPPYLKPDMTVSIDLTVATRRQVLTLPSEAVHASTTSAPWIFCVENGRIARREIELGIRGEGTLEVVSALEPELAVALPAARLLEVGQRVRVVPESHGER